MHSEHDHVSELCCAAAAVVKMAGALPDDEAAAGAPGGFEGATASALGRGASQTVQLLVADAGFLSMHSEHVHASALF